MEKMVSRLAHNQENAWFESCFRNCYKVKIVLG